MADKVGHEADVSAAHDEDQALDHEVEYHMRRQQPDICLCRIYGKWPRVKACPTCGDGGTKNQRRNRHRTDTKSVTFKDEPLRHSSHATSAENNADNRVILKKGATTPGAVSDMTSAKCVTAENELDINGNHGHDKTQKALPSFSIKPVNGQEKKAVNQASLSTEKPRKLVKPQLIPAAEFVKKYYNVDPNMIPPRNRIPFRLLMARTRKDVVLLTKDFAQLCDLYDVKFVID